MSFLEEYFPGKDKKVGLIGVPLGFGAAQMGSELGATAIRHSFIRGSHLSEHIKGLGYDLKDYGDVEVVKPNYLAIDGANPKYLHEMLATSKLSAAAVKQILKAGEIPVILGGDHSIAIGTFSGISSFFRSQGDEVGLIWFDAHADINTPDTSPSGNIHGMPFATILGLGNEELVTLEGFAPKLNPKFCAHVGARDLDLGEKSEIRNLGMRDNFFTMNDIDRRGMHACVEDAIKIAAAAPA